MADTFTPINGFLAGIYRSPGVLVGAVTKHQLLLNPSFETGDLTSWTDDSVATSTATATALKGWEDRSYGVVMSDNGINLCGISQITILDAALSAAQALTHRIIASVWVKFDSASDDAVLKVSALDAADGVLGTGSVTMISSHPYYDAAAAGFGVWSYFSIAISAVELTKKVKVEIYSNAATAQVWNIDNPSATIVEQVAGAFGQVVMPMGYDTEDVSTFATAGTAGWRSVATTLKKQSAITFPEYWVNSEVMAAEKAAATKVYIILWTQKATKTQDRFEFWALVNGIEWAAPVGEVQKGSVMITATGHIGYAHI